MASVASRVLPALLLSTSALVFGCSPPDPAWSVACTERGARDVIPGTGDGAFVSVDEGEVPVQSGSQGGQHIWFGVRVKNMGGPEVTVQFGIVNAEDPTIVYSGPLAEREVLGYNAEEEASEVAGMYGYLQTAWDPNTDEPLPGPEGKAIVLWADVTDECGTVHGESTAQVK